MTSWLREDCEPLLAVRADIELTVASLRAAKTAPQEFLRDQLSTLVANLDGLASKRDQVQAHEGPAQQVRVEHAPIAERHAPAIVTVQQYGRHVILVQPPEATPATQRIDENQGDGKIPAQRRGQAHGRDGGGKEVGHSDAALQPRRHPPADMDRSFETIHPVSNYSPLRRVLEIDRRGQDTIAHLIERAVWNRKQNRISRIEQKPRAVLTIRVRKLTPLSAM